MWSFLFDDQMFIEGREAHLLDQRMVGESLEEGITYVFKLGWLNNNKTRMGVVECMNGSKLLISIEVQKAVKYGRGVNGEDESIAHSDIQRIEGDRKVKALEGGKEHCVTYVRKGMKISTRYIERFIGYGESLRNEEF